MARGYVYFVHAPEVDRAKIGWSAEHPDARLADLRTGSAVALERMGYIRGKPDLERKLHAQFRHHKIRREWFHAGEDLKLFVAEHAEPWDVLVPSSREDRISVKAGAHRLEALFREWYRDHFTIGEIPRCITFAEFCEQRGVPFLEPLPRDVIRRAYRGLPISSP